MSRRGARLAAVEVLYAADVRGAEATALLEERSSADPVPEYATHLVEQVAQRHDEIDRILRERSIGWSPERMSPVDRNVLRIGVLELLEGEVPPASVIDEAVELAKRFSGERAGGFVNGVLAAVMAAQTPGGEGGG